MLVAFAGPIFTWSMASCRMFAFQLCPVTRSSVASWIWHLKARQTFAPAIAYSRWPFLQRRHCRSTSLSSATAVFTHSSPVTSVISTWFAWTFSPTFRFFSASSTPCHEPPSNWPKKTVPSAAAVTVSVTYSDVQTTYVDGGIAIAFGISFFGGIALTDCVGGLAIGLVAMLPLYFLRAAGAGDVKLMAMAGAFLGPLDTLGAVIFTWLAGALWLLIPLGLSWLAAPIQHRYFAALVLFPVTILTLALFETRRANPLRRVAFLGEISYASYLLHFPLQLAALGVVAALGLGREVFYSPWTLAAFIAVLLAASFASHRLFEMPAQRALRKRGLTYAFL